MRWILSIVCLAGLSARGAAEFTAASSQYGELLTWPWVTSYPCTMSCWFKLKSVSSQRLFAINSTTTERFQLDLDSSSNIVVRSIASGGGSSTAFHGPVHVGVWYHLVGTFASTTDRKLYLNGVLKDDDSGSVVVANLNSVYLGTGRASGSLGNYFNGHMLQAAIWSDVLTESEILSMGNTNSPVSPLRIRPQQLVFYAPMFHVGSAGTYNAFGPSVTWGAVPTTSDNNIKMGLP